jgi:error-prone DNA polymerase
VWGRLRRSGVRGASIVAERVWDLAALAAARRNGRLAEALAEAPGPPGSSAATPPRATGTGSTLVDAVPPLLHGIAVAPARKVWHASGGSAGR